MDRPSQTRLKRRPRRGALIAIDGIDGAALVVSAGKALAAMERTVRGGVSRWDASGIFEELRTGDVGAGVPSARTLLLLYAADLAFRLRWEIRPALAEGRAVIAAPYVATAVAFGRAAGLPAAWLSNLFRFAPRPTVRCIVQSAAARRTSDRQGFVEFGCERWAAAVGVKRRHIVDAISAHLRAASARGSRASAGRRRADR